MTVPLSISLEDRLTADVFQKSYREYLALKPTHYRWSGLAPQSVRYLQEAVEKHWSVEKVADYLHCDAQEAEGCRRRYVVSKKVNEKDGTAARIRQAFFEWTSGVVETDEKARHALASELSKIVANQLYAASVSKEDLQGISKELEGDSVSNPPEPKPFDSAGGKGSPWGPHWKD